MSFFVINRRIGLVNKKLIENNFENKEVNICTKIKKLTLNKKYISNNKKTNMIYLKKIVYHTAAAGQEYKQRVNSKIYITQSYENRRVGTENTCFGGSVRGGSKIKF